MNKITLNDKVFIEIPIALCTNEQLDFNEGFHPVTVVENNRKTFHWARYNGANWHSDTTGAHVIPICIYIPEDMVPIELKEEPSQQEIESGLMFGIIQPVPIRLKAYDKKNKIISQVLCVNWEDKFMTVRSGARGAILRPLHEMHILRMSEFFDCNDTECKELDVVEVPEPRHLTRIITYHKTGEWRLADKRGRSQRIFQKDWKGLKIIGHYLINKEELKD